MSNDSLHNKLEKILEIANSARDPEISTATQTELIDLATREFIDFMNDCVGDLFALKLWSIADPNDPITFNKLAIARLIYDFKPILDQAKINTDLITNDLYQMSKSGGSNARILTPSKRTKGQKNNNELKKPARERFVKLVYEESGRRSITIEQSLALLAPIEDDEDGKNFEARKRLWEAMSAEIPIEDRKEARKNGKTLIQPSYAISDNHFLELWKLAKKK